MMHESMFTQCCRPRKLGFQDHGEQYIYIYIGYPSSLKSESRKVKLRGHPEPQSEGFPHLKTLGQSIEQGMNKCLFCACAAHAHKPVNFKVRWPEEHSSSLPRILTKVEHHKGCFVLAQSLET